MAEFLSIAEINERFESEWILLEDPETTPMLEVTGGKLLCHSRDRDEVYRSAKRLRPKYSAIIYTGSSIPEGTAVMI